MRVWIELATNPVMRSWALCTTVVMTGGSQEVKREEEGWCDNPQVQGIIVAIPNGGSDKYVVSNPQGAKGKINILSSPICH